ncbi:MAG: hypothetical protein AUG51_17280 [Acidobacteria bacterium 13_1_20CM_3_53_8]|nr:MAG: hypothetical protein AUG51_17280 [Acidobacteria bacterium 13_1_20CM_3_53_8]
MDNLLSVENESSLGQNLTHLAAAKKMTVVVRMLPFRERGFDRETGFRAKLAGHVLCSELSYGARITYLLFFVHSNF